MGTKTLRLVQGEESSASANVLARVRHVLDLAYWTKPSQRKILRTAAAADTLRKVARLAEQLGVDPRWLATGIISRAGAAACACLRENGWMPADQNEDGPLPFLEMLTEPDLGAGVCRYCQCTDEFSCGACEWVDAARTICSDCLEGPEE